MNYRIIKRKNKTFTDKDEYVLQAEGYRNQIMAQAQNQIMGQGYIPYPTWQEIQVFATLQEAKARKTFLLTGLSPGEEIVG